MDFIIGGISATCAVIFSNPFDVIKTRQQLQDELRKSSPNANQPYTGIWKSIKSVVKSDGLLGLQKGLSSAMAFQFTNSAIRLGLFETFDSNGWTRFGHDEPRSKILCVLVGAGSGIVAAVIGSPFYQVKVRIQSQSAAKDAVGYQHHHKGTFDALSSIYRQNGVGGLWTGSLAIVPRNATSSATQLASFTYMKDFLRQYEVFQNSIFFTSVVGSIVSGFCTCIAMTPFDVAATRMFNQGVDKNGRGLFYRNVIDCLLKTAQAEGIRGLYKGFFPNYCRQAPHILLNLTFWEQLKKLRDTYLPKKS